MGRPKSLTPKTGQVNGDEHVVLHNYKTHDVVDPTGDQFGYPRRYSNTGEHRKVKGLIKLKKPELDDARDEAKENRRRAKLKGK
jgi:hypothetical protein